MARQHRCRKPLNVDGTKVIYELRIYDKGRNKPGWVYCKGSWDFCDRARTKLKAQRRARNAPNGEMDIIQPL